MPLPLIGRSFLAGMLLHIGLMRMLQGDSFYGVICWGLCSALMAFVLIDNAALKKQVKHGND